MMHFDPDISKDMSVDIKQESTRMLAEGDTSMMHKDSLGDERDAEEIKLVSAKVANVKQKSTMQSLMDKNDRYSYMNDQS